MQRYQMVDGGVLDRQLGRVITPSSLEWVDYELWLQVSGAPDPADPAPAADPALVRVEKLAAINQVRGQHLANGVVFNSFTFDCDERSRARLVEVIALLAAGVALPANFTWRASDNTDVPMTGAQLVGLLAKIRQQTQAVFSFSWQLKVQVVQAADPSTIDITQGWPA